ncbi:hypothetical protein AB205_0041980 [Aquarana catesbeiana]|uniref:Uncharacterized protein n=1 Tax=Aquarana catesbeiana TaxID=8400 RepID=A0A2G9RTW2_AQUCT|nr:hypothetical protein AB205_0041980 [Aquarana catesbeiana]
MFWASLKDSFRSEHTLPNFKSEMNDIKFPDSDPSAANNYSWFFIFPFLNFSFLFWGWRSTHCFGSHLMGFHPFLEAVSIFFFFPFCTDFVNNCFWIFFLFLFLFLSFSPDYFTLNHN